jgi:hypothetical protein
VKLETQGHDMSREEHLKALEKLFTITGKAAGALLKLALIYAEPACFYRKSIDKSNRLTRFLKATEVKESIDKTPFISYGKIVLIGVVQDYALRPRYILLLSNVIFS